MIKKSCVNCLKGYDAITGSRIKYCSPECRKEYQKKHDLRSLPKGEERSVYVDLVCFKCNSKFRRREAEAIKTKKHFCSLDCYRNGGAKDMEMSFGRPRKRPGGKGLPPHAQPETIEADKTWKVKSWFDDRGYTLLYMPDCPYAPKSTGRIYEHRLIIAIEEGRKLEREEHVDHIVPLAKGGTNERSNLQLLTRSNHAKKTAKENVVEWRKLAKLVEESGLTLEQVAERLT